MIDIRRYGYTKLIEKIDFLLNDYLCPFAGMVFYIAT